MNSRYQDGEIGRFLSQDSVASRFDPSSAEGQAMMLDPQLQNTYSYAANNPLKYTDPDGEFIETAVDIAFLSLSIRDFKQNPSLSNAAWVGADLIGAAIPGVPAIAGIIRHGDDILKGAKKGADAVDVVGDSAKSAKSLENTAETSGNGAIKLISSENKNIGSIAENIGSWLGKDSKVITNKAGDKVFMSKDGLKKVRFDIRNNGNDKPHMHFEYFKNGKWQDVYNGKHRIYPERNN